MQDDTSRYEEVSNSFSICVLTHSGFEQHAEFSKKYGHPKNSTKEQLKELDETLNDIKSNHPDIYERLYKKLFELILTDTLKSKSDFYSVFDKTRDFMEYVKQIQNNEDSIENICKNYEQKEWWESKIS